jgi:hypothetical protein
MEQLKTTQITSRDRNRITTANNNLYPKSGQCLGYVTGDESAAQELCQQTLLKSGIIEIL